MYYKLKHIVLLLLAAGIPAISGMAQNPTPDYDASALVVRDGLQGQDALKQRIEQTTTALFTEINRAQSQKRDPDFSGLDVGEDARMTISMLWKNAPFRISRPKVVQVCLGQSGGGYQVRYVPVSLRPSEKSADNRGREAVLTYSAQGEITDFYFCLNKLEMNAFMEGVAKEVRDSRIAQQILSFVENYRTAYNTKDTEYLRNVFSDDALIVTGRVITPRKRQSIEHGGFSAPTVAYTSQNKEQYLENLFALFKKVSYINVQFADIVVRQHPENPNFYAVTLKQDWHASNYSDEGIVNLLWEFEPTDPGEPLKPAKIWVRTWEPEKLPTGATHIDIVRDTNPNAGKKAEQ